MRLVLMTLGLVLGPVLGLVNPAYSLNYERMLSPSLRAV